MTGTPAESLRRAAALLGERAEAVEAEMASPQDRYWGETGSESYRTGVRNGLGGASGELAALLTPEAARSLSAWLTSTANRATEPGGIEDSAAYPFKPTWHRLPLAVALGLLGEVPA
jgi:hypothetical protein